MCPFQLFGSLEWGHNLPFVSPQLFNNYSHLPWEQHYLNQCDINPLHFMGRAPSVHPTRALSLSSHNWMDLSTTCLTSLYRLAKTLSYIIFIGIVRTSVGTTARFLVKRARAVLVISPTWFIVFVTNVVGSWWILILFHNQHKSYQLIRQWVNFSVYMGDSCVSAYHQRWNLRLPAWLDLEDDDLGVDICDEAFGTSSFHSRSNVSLLSTLHSL